MIDKNMRVFKKGDRVVTNTGTHAFISKVLKGGNAGWYDLQVRKWPYTISCWYENLQKFGEADWHGEWTGPDRLEG